MVPKILKKYQKMAKLLFEGLEKVRIKIVIE